MPNTIVQKTKTPRNKVSRRMRDLVHYRGKDRLVIVTLDSAQGTVSVRLLGCRESSLYIASDLARFPSSTPQLGLPFAFAEEEQS